MSTVADGTAPLSVNSTTMVPNLNADLLDGQHGPFWQLGGNSGTTPGTNFLGTTDNQALEFKVNNARALRLEFNGTSPNVIGGYSGNSVTAGVYGATIGGGGASGNTNRVSNNYCTVGGGMNNEASGGGSWGAATVGGGYQNTASADFATVGGGASNTASADYATIAGGGSNTASGGAATVGGGGGNAASGLHATVGGGSSNAASAPYATVPGGENNTAAGNYSFAAGRRAKAVHDGSFVWGDSTDADVVSTASNEFKIRASGGVYLYNRADLGSGCILYPGAGGWSCSSDRNLKENFTPVDGQEVLASLAEMPITTWNYKAQDASISHMGPVAQDFYAAFGLGESDTSISTVDLDGVALAAIQGLYELSQEQAAHIQALEEENANLRQGVEDLETRVTALEGGAGTSGAAAGPLSSDLSAGWLALGGLGVVAGLILVQRRRTGGQR